MDEKKPDAFLDELLEASLKRYSSVEPRVGLEEGVLAHLRAQPAGAPWLGWSWAARTAVAMVVLLAALLVFWQQSTPPAPAAPEAARGRKPVVSPLAMPESETPPPAASPATPSVARRMRPAVGAPSAARVVLTAAPRRGGFPAPAPLSEQEQLLVRFVAVAPKESLLASESASRGRVALEIEPLAVADLVVEKLERNP